MEKGSALTVAQFPPLIAISLPRPESLTLVHLFRAWPTKLLDTMDAAQDKRDKLCTIIKRKSPNQLIIEAIDDYLPYALFIEKQVNTNHKVLAHTHKKLRWKASNAFSGSSSTITFKPDDFSLEILCLLWLRGITLFDDASNAADALQFEASQGFYKEAAGIFQAIALDRTRITAHKKLPAPFASGVLKLFQLLSLAQCQAIIAYDIQAEKPVTKYSYSIYMQFKEMQTQLVNPTIRRSINEVFFTWLHVCELYFHGSASLSLALSLIAKEEYGKAVGLLRLSNASLADAESHAKKMSKVLEYCRTLHTKVKDLYEKWMKDNLHIYMQPVPSGDDSSLLLASLGVPPPTFPLPSQYSLPAAFDPDA